MLYTILPHWLFFIESKYRLIPVSIHFVLAFNSKKLFHSLVYTVFANLNQCYPVPLFPLLFAFQIKCAFNMIPLYVLFLNVIMYLGMSIIITLSCTHSQMMMGKWLPKLWKLLRWVSYIIITSNLDHLFAPYFMQLMLSVWSM